MITLRPYQASLLERTQASMRAGHRAPLLVAPCGAGKTVMFSYMARAVSAKGKVVYILAHRDELVQQISDTLADFDVAHSFIAAGRPYRPGLRVYVCSVMSLAKRIEKQAAAERQAAGDQAALSRIRQSRGYIHPPDVIIMDEAHHAVAGSWRKVASAYPAAYRVGVTATPERLDGTGLGDVFDDMVLGPTVPELIRLGALCPFRLFAPPGADLRGIRTLAGDYAKGQLAKAVDRPKITGDAVEHYRRLAPGHLAVVFACSLEHAEHVAVEYRRAGFEFYRIDGNMDAGLRADLVGKFRRRQIQGLVSVDLISEGFDLPAVEVAQSLRPTQSKALWIQQAGRALRPSPGKDRALILDHAGNCERHGMPDEEHAWTLEGAKRKAKGEGVADVRVRKCPKCFATYRAGVQACTHVWPDGTPCGHVFVAEAEPVKHAEGELVEVDAAEVKKRRAMEQGQARTLAELVALAKARGYKAPWFWANKVLASRR